MKLKIYKHIGIKENIDDDIAQIRAYFLSDFVKSIIPGGIDIQLDVEQTSVVKLSAYDSLMKPLEGKYDIVMYCYERPEISGDFLGETFYISKKIIGIYQGIDKRDDDLSYIWKCMCHELLHAVTDLIGAEKGVNIPNRLDFPLKNGVVDQSIYLMGNQNPYLINGNFYQQLRALAPYMKKIDVIITREPSDNMQTLGTLIARIGNTTFTCRTLELPWLNNKPNISCVPKGIYTCKWTFSPRLMRYSYELQGVLGRSGIRFHSGNYYYDLKGCIALGDSVKDINNDKELDVLNSRATMKSFEALFNTKPFTLEIK